MDRLYRKHSAEVLRYAQLVLRSRTEAEDITQTVFMRALRAIERGEKVRTPRNWLIKITHNECRRLLASRKVHAELPDEIAVEPAEQGRAEELRAAMAALPAHQRQALVLRELEGRTYAEIAASLDLSVSAVETLIFRARRALREQIENGLGCDEFALLLEDPSARTRVRAHARICPDCATLERQARGRKSALKRIASALGLPGWGTWWGAKLAAVAVTTATVAAVAVPHDGARPSVPASTPSTAVAVKGIQQIPPSSNPNLASRVTGGVTVRSLAAKHPHARLRVVAAPIEEAEAPAVAPEPAPVIPIAPAQPSAPTPQPDEAPLPPAAAAVPAAAPAVPATVAVPAVPPVPEPVAAPVVPAVTVPQTVLPPAPAVTTPTVSVPVSLPPVPTVTLPVETPKVILP